MEYARTLGNVLARRERVPKFAGRVLDDADAWRERATVRLVEVPGSGDACLGQVVGIRGDKARDVVGEGVLAGNLAKLLGFTEDPHELVERGSFALAEDVADFLGDDLPVALSDHVVGQAC